MIFLSCALFWKEVLAHAAPRVSSLALKAVLPSLSHSFPSLSLFISVVDTLKVVTEEVTTTTTVSTTHPLLSSRFSRHRLFTRCVQLLCLLLLLNVLWERLGYEATKTFTNGH